MSSAKNINSNDAAIAKRFDFDVNDEASNGEATLRRRASTAEINENEGRILLRQIDDAGKTLLTTYYALRKNSNTRTRSNTERCSPDSRLLKWQQQQQQQQNSGGNNNSSSMTTLTNSALATADEDAQSFTTSTTTSDVNSNDDATSIVSRMSQIVVEQEEKLFSPSKRSEEQHPRPHSHPSHSSNDKKPTSGFLAPSWSISSRPTNGKSKKSVSSTFVPGEQPRKFSSTGEQPLFKTGLNITNKSNQQQDTKDGLATSCTTTKSTLRLRAKSVVDQQKRDEFTSTLYQSDSSSFLPERGTLKALETNRKISAILNGAQVQAQATIKQQQQQQQQVATPDYQHPDADDDYLLNARSKRAGSFDSQTMLNIRRSTWTLSEFDETFNRQPAYPPLTSEVNSQVISSNADNNNNININNNQQQQQNRSVASRTYSSNLSSQVGSVKQANFLSSRPFSASHDKLASSGNLFMLASKNNAISATLNNQLTPTLSIANGHLINYECNQAALTNQQPYHQYPLDEHGRRRFSVVSFASSYDSSCQNSSERLNKGRSRTNKSIGKRDHHGGQENGSADQEGGTFSSRAVSGFNTVKKYVPVLEWLPSYNRNQFAGDLMAGLVVATLNISINLSAAVVAETDPGTAFRASIISTFVYSFLCSSKHTSFGSWSIMSQMMVISVKRALSDELLLDRLNIGPSASWLPLEYERWHLNIIVMYTFLIGLVQLVSGLLNLGNILASFIPEALGSSLIAATAFTMAIGQLANMCGTSNKILWSIERNTTALWADLKNPPVDITDLSAGLFRWIKQIALLIKYHEQINIVCVIISVVSVILLFLNQCFIQKQLENFFKRKILIPFEVIIVVLMIVISYYIGLKENYNVTTCGAIHIDFGVPNIPNLKLIRELWFESLATALISYSMVYVMSKTYSNKFNYDVEYNQELIACGAGNLIGGLFDALPSTASFSRTAAKVEAGGQTQMASFINCAVLLVLAHFLGEYVTLLPVCVTSAALFFGFVRMMKGFQRAFVYWRICKVDFTIWMFNFVAILTLDIVNGFVYGFIFSILTMLYRAQNRRCYMLGSIGSADVYVPLVKYPLAQEIDGIKIFQFCGPIHYVCAELFERLLRQKTRVNVKQIACDIMKKPPDEGKFNPRDLNIPTHIILDFSMISYIDTAGINVIKKIIEDYQKINIAILIASLASHVASMVKSDPDLWNNYHDRFYITLADAVHCALRDRRIQEADINVKT